MRIFFEFFFFFFFFRFLIFVSFEVEESPFKFSDTCSRTFGTERHAHTRIIKLYIRGYTKKNDKAYLPRINLHKYFAKRNASLHELHMLFLTRYELHVTAVYYTTAEIKLKSVLICTMGHVESVKARYAGC